MTPALFEQLEQAFDRAREASAAERAAIIEDLRLASNEAAEQLRVMLDTPELDRSRAAELIVDLADGQAIEESIAGQTIDRYRLLSTLGEGGCGVVYLAEQPAPSHRLVAIKVIKPGMDTKQVLARFNDERQAMALMDHPCLVTSIDAGATREGRPYVVMPLIPGLAITRFCDEERLSVEERVRLMVKVCRGIEHAHAKGVIHRDIKPANILVSRTEEDVLPRVIDFGLARAIEGSLTAHSTVTLAGQIIGTPDYMSPEQAAGAGADVRTDVYSLGAVLYELLAGKPPIDPQALRADGAAGVAAALKSLVPLAPSRHGTSRFRRELDWIALKCLEKEPVRRYQTVAALADDLERYLAEKRVEAGPPARLYRAGRWVKRHRLLLIAAALAAAGIVAGFWYAQAARHRAEQVSQVMRSMLTSLNPQQAQGRDTELLLMMLDGSRTFLTQPGLDPRVELDVRETLATANHATGRHLDARTHATRADELIRRLEGDESVRRIGMLTILLNATMSVPLSGSSVEAEQARFVEQMTRVAEANVADDPLLPLKVRVEATVANQGPLEARRGLLAEVEAEFGPDDAYTIRTMWWLARLLIDLKDSEGRRLLEEARRRASSAFGPDHPLAHRMIATELLGVLFCGGTPEELIDMAKERLPNAERVLGRRHQMVSVAYGNWAQAEWLLSRCDAAIAIYRRTLELEYEARGEASSFAKWHRGGLASIALHCGQWDLFVECEARAFEVEPDGPTIHPDAYRSIITNLELRGDVDRLKRWTAARDRRHPPSAP